MTFFKQQFLFLFSSFLFLLAGITAKAQQPKISITPSTLEVKEVLKQLEQKANLNFIYSGLEDELSSRVTLPAPSLTVPEILRQLAGQTPLEFHQSGNTIAIRKSLAKAKNRGSIQGVVTDATQSPVQGATVTLSGGRHTTTTNEQGRFAFNDVAADKYTLTVTHISFTEKKQTVIVDAGQPANLQLTLQAAAENTRALDPIVVTGQYRPQSLDKSIYRVEVIDKKQIQNMAVTNVGELLKQQLNIEIENTSEMGRSKIRVLGLNSQYIKILMDNIPIAGDNSMGSDVDLSTITLDDVERVEIVKGAMGVEYGANSIGGVVNIITKKTARNKTDLALEIQEETVRNEYNWGYDTKAKGRHIQRMNISHKLTGNLSIGGTISRDQFNGYWGDRIGAGLIREPIQLSDPPKRGYEWSPKTSWNGNSYLSYTGKKLNLFYKFNYFLSNLTHYGRNPQRMELKDEQISVNAGENNDYRNTRFNHHLNIRGDFWKNATYTVDASFQKNGLEHRRQAINLQDNSVIDPVNGIPGSERKQAIDWNKYYQSQGFYMRSTLLKPIIDDKLHYSFGVEMDNTTGNQGYTNWFNDVSLSAPLERTLFNGAAYTSAEWQVSKKIMIRPGFRVNYNNQSKMRTNESITTRYRLNDRNDLRLIFGTSTRFPNYEELYSWFVDAVHDFRGNPDLLPEYGKSVELQWAHRRELNNNIQLETSLSSMFQDIRDRIVPITYYVDDAPQLTGRNTFTNENKYNGLLNQININLASDKFAVAVAGSLLAYRGDDDASISDYRRFLTNEQATAQFTYVLPKDIRVALFYRYVGKQPIYTFVRKPWKEGDDKVSNEFYKILNIADDYHNTDFNVARNFFKKKIDLRLGVRNIFDVRDVRFKPVAVPPELPYYNPDHYLRFMRLYYGRSYFLKLTYNLFS